MEHSPVESTEKRLDLEDISQINESNADKYIEHWIKEEKDPHWLAFSSMDVLDRFSLPQKTLFKLFQILSKAGESEAAVRIEELIKSQSPNTAAVMKQERTETSIKAWTEMGRIPYNQGGSLPLVEALLNTSEKIDQTKVDELINKIVSSEKYDHGHDQNNAEDAFLLWKKLGGSPETADKVTNALLDDFNDPDSPQSMEPHVLERAIEGAQSWASTETVKKLADTYLKSRVYYFENGLDSMQIGKIRELLLQVPGMTEAAIRNSYDN